MRLYALKTRKKLAWLCIISISMQILAPIPSYALTSGPNQPEFSSFEPVATTNMVNDFTGDFTYNIPIISIPGASGGGYALSLSYNGGSSVEEEASWVGLGWNINPGVINRGTRGYPDDWEGENVKFWNKVPDNWTVSIGGKVKAELFSFNLPVGLDASLRYNNYKGFGYSAGVGVQLGKGVVSLGYHVDDGSGSFSLALNPAAALENMKDKGKTDEEKQAPDEVKGRKKARAEQQKYRNNPDIRKKTYLKSKSEKSTIPQMGSLSLLGSSYGIFSYGSVTRTTQVSEYTGASFTLTPSVLGTLIPIQAGPTYNLFGSFSTQSNVASENLPVFGYMYSAQAQGDDVLDYFVEKASPYNKRDKFLGIPFPNVDNYAISGEGIGGGFRMYNKKAGHYFPNNKKSNTTIVNLGIEIEAGLNLGGGGDIGVGSHELSVDGWNNLTSFSDVDDLSVDEPIVFRFNNDLGGEVDFFDSDNPQKASINFAGGIIGGKSFTASLPTGIKSSMNDGARTKRSSYIGYTRNDDYSAVTDGIRYKTYNKQTTVENLVDRSNIGKQVGEFSVTNEDGNRYVYGLPVFSRKERNLQFGLQGLSASNIQNRYVAYKNITPLANQKTVVGEERQQPYASTYLLTEITDPDYIDRTFDGPTRDDFGGWTKFNYTRKYGSNDKVNGSGWFKWRVPYNGLLYNRNELSDPEDDMGSLMDGEKEIYYLDAIETKTHIARFFLSDREDGLSAHTNDGTASGTPGAKGSQRLFKLDKIELLAKDEYGNPAKLIKRVCFEYDYSLCGMMPNNSGATIMQNGININANKGKLTLKKVWFEYEGAVEARISPYVFQYTYPITPVSPAPNDVNYPSRYDGYENYGNGLVQNPNYSPFDIDAWGNYQKDGNSRFNNMIPWVNQAPASGFDPAAWQLKAIILPSGGQIHVQYGQDEYSYVQDERAHVMVNLLEPNSSDLSNKYYLNYSGLGLTAGDLPRLKQLINTLYVNPQKKMYFKFLYKLIGAFSDPQLEDCNAEYVTGYVNVKEVDIDSNGIYVRLGLPGLQGIHDLPIKVCQDMVKTQKAGKLSIDGSICDPAIAGVDNSGGPEDIIMNFVGFLTSFSFPGSTCNEVNMDLSYLRIPSVKAKKGGGIRVERILMYDKGLDSGYPQLFGTEYLYETKDPVTGEIISSGVATNEPQSIREENVLISFLDRFKQSFVSKVISGRDKKQTEGMIGESVMPGPSIGYSKIIAKNIHSGKTNPGFTIKEYYTAKDYPFISEMTELDNSKKDNLTLPLGLVNRYVNNQWLSQGFSFTINNMHGQMKREAAYGGNYSDIHNPASLQQSTLKEYEYFKPGEQLTYWNGFGEPLTQGNPGKEEELIFESSMISDINNDGNVEFDVDVGFFGVIPLPFASGFSALTFAETELYTHKTVKIIRYPAIVKSVKSYQDGIYHLTRNKYFDSETGQAIVTETFDGYNELDLLNASNHDGTYTNYSFPAHLHYPSTGQKAKNERKTVYSGAVQIDKEVTGGQAFLMFSATAPGISVCDAMNNFTAGDLVNVAGHLYHTGNPTGSKIPIYPLHASTLGSGATAINVEIAKSGQTNQLSSKIGAITTYGTSSTTTYPIPASVMNPRTQFANLLNNALSSGNPIYPSMIPAGLQFIDENGNCGPFPSDRHIIIQNNTLKIIGPVTPPAMTIVGTPLNPHPMVTALNDYFTTYFDYGLDPLGTGTLICNIGTETLEKKPYFNPSDVQFMQDAQNTALQQNYSAVNGGIHSISDFFKDVNIDLGYAVTRRSNTGSPTRKNKSVILESISTASRFGIFEQCSPLKALQICNVFCTQEGMVCQTLDDVEPTYQPVFPAFGETEDGWLIVSQPGGDTCELSIRFFEIRTHTDSVKCESALNVSAGGGQFEIDPENGRLVFYAADNPCFPQPFECLKFCNDAYPSTRITNVVASNAATLNDYWNYNEQLYYPVYSGNYNDYEKGKRGKWRVQSNYVFKEQIAGINSPFASGAPYNAGSGEKTYNAGVYELELFNWKYEGANNDQKWLKLNTTTQYSPNGNALEEVDILNISSSAKFGYHSMLPYLVAKNSAYSAVLFESFENQYQSGGDLYLEDGLRLDPADGVIATIAHSGSKSLKLVNNPDGLHLAQIAATDHLLNQGLSLKVWVKTEVSDYVLIQDNLKTDVRLNSNPSVIITAAGFEKIAQSGEWTLYEARLIDISPAITLSDVINIHLKFDFNTSGVQHVWIDDLRMQPLDAQMTCYVYDVKTLRLIASFDDQHFGLYYQYDEEGKLVRKLIETERGMKTLQETQYNTPKVNRN